MEIPTKCPSCGSTLERVNAQLFCRNPSCGEVAKQKVASFAKVMEIKGLGEKTIEKLNISSIEDIYLLDEGISDIIGEKLGAKLLLEIEKSKTVTLDKFLAACSIPLIGKGTSRKIANIVSTPEEINMETCKEAGVGEKATNNLIYWLNTDYNTLKHLPLDFRKAKEVGNRKYVVCISGKIPGYTKKSLSEYLDTFGVSTIDNVTKETTHVISESNTSSKCKKAISMGIPVMKLNDFIKEIS